MMGAIPKRSVFLFCGCFVFLFSFSLSLSLSLFLSFSLSLFLSLSLSLSLFLPLKREADAEEFLAAPWDLAVEAAGQPAVRQLAARRPAGTINRCSTVMAEGPTMTINR